MTNYNLFKVDDSLNVGRLQDGSFPTSSLGNLGIRLRFLKTKLLADQNQKDAFVNILSPVIDDLSYNAIYSNEDTVIDASDSSFQMMVEVINNLGEYMNTYGTVDFSTYHGARVVTFTNQNGVPFPLLYTWNGSDELYPVGKCFGILDDNGVYHNIIFYDGDNRVTFNGTMVNSEGQRYLISDLVSDLINSIEIQEVMHDAIQIKDNLNEKYSLNDIFAKFSTSKEEVRQYANQFISAASSGGIFAVLSVIKDSYTALNNIQADSDGLIDYVDYSIWMPKSFIAGCLTTIVQVVSSVITAIATVISPIIGIVVGAISLIANLIINAITFTKQTHVSVIDSVAALPCYAIPVLANEKSIAGNVYVGDNTDIGDCINNNHIPILLNCYGCWHIVSSENVNSLDNIIRYNSFIDIIDRRSVFSGKITKQTWQNEGGGIQVSYDEYSFSQTSYDEIFENASQPSYDNNFQTFVPEYGADGFLTANSDLNLRLIICVNILYFFINYSHIMINAVERAIPAVSTTYNGSAPVYLNRKDYTWWGCTSDQFNYIFGVLGPALKYLYDGSISSMYTPDWADISLCLDALQHTTLEHFRLPNSTIIWVNTVGYLGDYMINAASALTMYEDGFYPTVIPPSYDRGEVIATLAFIAAATIVTTITAVVVSRSVRKKIQTKRATLAAKVEKAHNDFVNDPTNIDKYNEYRSAVTKNNLSNMVLGGTKYSKVNYWDSADNSSSTNIASKLKNAVLISDDQYDATNSVIIRLIKGND